MGKELKRTLRFSVRNEWSPKRAATLEAKLSRALERKCGDWFLLRDLASYIEHLKRHGSRSITAVQIAASVRDLMEAHPEWSKEQAITHAAAHLRVSKRTIHLRLKGSEFVVSLPIEEERSMLTADRKSHAPNHAEGLRILVVDDNRDAAESLAMVLSLDGHDVRTAGSATEALETVQGYKPDVMLVGIGMPGLNGYQLAERVSKMADLKSTVLVATSGYGQEEARQQGAQAGFARYLVKPIDRQTVENLLLSVASRKQR